MNRVETPIERAVRVAIEDERERIMLAIVEAAWVAALDWDEYVVDVGSLEQIVKPT